MPVSPETLHKHTVDTWLLASALPLSLSLSLFVFADLVKIKHSELTE
jgi:hypothetical protein